MIVGFIVISQQELTKKQVRQRIIQMFQEEWTKETPPYTKNMLCDRNNLFYNSYYFNRNYLFRYNSNIKNK